MIITPAAINRRPEKIAAVWGLLLLLLSTIPISSSQILLADEEPYNAVECSPTAIFYDRRLNW
jgi:hypothetical protein